jgi:hypothetical protein
MNSDVMKDICDDNEYFYDTTTSRLYVSDDAYEKITNYKKTLVPNKALGIELPCNINGVSNYNTTLVQISQIKNEDVNNMPIDVLQFLLTVGQLAINKEIINLMKDRRTVLLNQKKGGSAHRRTKMKQRRTKRHLQKSKKRRNPKKR